MNSRSRSRLKPALESVRLSRALIIDPAFWLATMLFVFPIASVTRYRYFYLVGAVSMPFVVTWILRNRILAASAVRAVIVPLFLFPWMFMSTLWALDRSVTLAESSRSLIFLWVSLLAAFTAARSARLVMRTLVPMIIPAVGVASVLSAIFGAVRAVDAEMLARVGSFSGTAPPLVLPVIAIGMLCPPKPRLKGLLFSALLLAAGAYIVFLSESRAAYALFGFELIVIACVLALTRRRSRGAEALVLLFTIVGALLAVLMAPNLLGLGGVIDRIVATQVPDVIRGLAPVRGLGDYARAEMYYQGLDAIRQYPVLGVGWGGIGVLVLRNAGFWLIAHNLILSFWGELGLVGLGLFLVASFRAIRGPVWVLLRCDARLSIWMLALSVVLGFGISLAFGMVRPEHLNPTFWVLLAMGPVLPHAAASHQKTETVAPPKRVKGDQRTGAGRGMAHGVQALSHAPDRKRGPVQDAPV